MNLDLTGVYTVAGILAAVFLCCLLWLIIAGASRSARQHDAERDRRLYEAWRRELEADKPTPPTAPGGTADDADV